MSKAARASARGIGRQTATSCLSGTDVAEDETSRRETSAEERVWSLPREATFSGASSDERSIFRNCGDGSGGGVLERGAAAAATGRLVEIPATIR